MRVLVIEDDDRIASYVAQALAEEAFTVDRAADGETGLELATTYEYDALVLDVMLPRLDGFSLCRRLRDQRNKVPVLMLSARDMVDDRVLGLDAGADDYLVKPFAIAELTARLRALSRRRQGTPAPRLALGDLELDPASRTVRLGGQHVTLTQKEYALLEYFMRKAGFVLTRTMIAEHVWGQSFEYSSNVVDVYVKHLRDKIDRKGGRSYIHAVRGVGYAFRDPAAPDP